MSVNEGSGLPMIRYRGLDATESEIRTALMKATETIEWEKGGVTFVLSIPARVIVRAGAMGGDVFDVHGGWKYLRPADMFADWREIKHVAPDYRRGKR